MNVLTFGATGNGATDDTAALQAALNATPAGGTLVLPRPPVAYRTTRALTVPRPMTIRGDGSLAELRRTTRGSAILTIAANDVTLDGVALRGTYDGTVAMGRDNDGGIEASGRSGLTLRNLQIRDVGDYAIYLATADDFLIEDAVIQTVFAGGVFLSSSKNGTVQRTTVKDVKMPGSETSGYAFVLGSQSGAVGENVNFLNNVAENCPWECYDAHAGSNILWRGNRATNYGRVGLNAAFEGAVGCRNCRVEHNTFVRGSTPNVSGWPAAPSIFMASGGDGQASGSIVNNGLPAAGDFYINDAGGLRSRVTVSGNVVGSAPPPP